MTILCNEHAGVEQRCTDAYDVAKRVGYALKEGVKANVGNSTVMESTMNEGGYDMELAFVSDKNGAIGFTTSTFSFNLPAQKNRPANYNEDLAQLFTDKICANTNNFKPCVSFGQANGLVYATVPATSTQGAIA